MPQAFKRRGMTLARPPLKRRARSRIPLRGSGTFRGRFAGQIHAGREYKFHDTLISNTLFTQAGAVLTNGSLNEIPQGVEESQRIGRKVVVKSLQMKAKIFLANASNGATSQLYRVIIFQDKQANGAAAVVLDILEQASTLSFRNLANSSRFKIWYDETKHINSTAAAGNGTTNVFSENFRYLQLHIPMNVPLEFDNTAATGAIATIRSNNLGLLVMMQEAAEDVFIQTTIRLRFSDA